MSGYMKYALHKFHRPTPTIPQHSPHQCKAPDYGSTAPQMVHPTDNSPELNPEDFDTVQNVVWTCLYYLRTVNPTILVTINSIAPNQEKFTKATAKKLVQLLSYVATHPEAIAH